MSESLVVVKSIGYFMLAGLFEIGGGYLIWLWLREGKPIIYAFLEVIVLIAYGISRRCSPHTSVGYMPPTVGYLS